MLKKKIRQRFFVARELQATIAILVVIALLGGIILQFASKSFTDYLRLDAPYLTVFLMTGYIGIIVFCALFFTHRLIGPFKRLEYEMKWIANGELERRLSVRGRDDFHVRSFINEVNSLIDKFEEMSLDYNKLNSALSQCINEITEKLDSQAPTHEIKTSLEELRERIHRMRESW
jgi:methyl-accepting chemotaxis protein